MIKIKNIFLWASLIFILAGCVPSNLKWQPAENLSTNWKKVQVGDIIIKNKTMGWLEWFAHIGIVVTPKTIGDYPQPFAGYIETNYKYWLDEPNRKVVVLRYKNMTEEFKTQLLKNIAENKSQDYVFWFGKTSNSSTYCSKYVWYLYWKTAKDLGYELDLDRDGGPFVYPYDFLGADNLEVVEI